MNALSAGISAPPPLPRSISQPPTWAVVYAAVLPVAASFVVLWLMAALPTPRCTFHTLTGLPCPTCGMTRATQALLRGDFVAALAWNPLCLPAFLVTIVFWGWCVLLAVRVLPAPSPAHTALFPFALRVALGFLLLNWVYLLFFSPHIARH
jgi:hypothetical protein